MWLNDGDEKLALGRAFHGALVGRDWTTLRTLLADDAVWTLPGDNSISGRVEGGEAVVHRARLIAGYGLTFTLERLLVSRDNLALSLHNTARRNGVVLDERLATVCRIKDGRIAEIETYLDDVKGMNAFFR
jgi:ketosteroid isomerase-like protein